MFWGKSIATFVFSRFSQIKAPPPASGLNFLNQVDEDIWQLRNKLPPIDRKAILRQMKAENVAQAERQCTCEMVECSQEEAEQAAGGECLLLKRRLLRLMSGIYLGDLVSFSHLRVAG